LAVNEIINFMLPPEGGIRFRNITIVGAPESGKTNLAFYIANKIIERKGENNVNLIYVKYLKHAFKFFDDKQYQLVLVDDAIRGQDYRSVITKLGRKTRADFYEIRHKLREAAKRDEDLAILVIFITQRLRALATDYRNAPVMFFKSVLLDPYDREYIKKILPHQYYKILKDITRRMYMGEDKAKGEAIAATAWDKFYHVKGIKKVKIKIDLMDKDMKDPLEEIADHLLEVFGDRILSLNDSIIRGYLRQYAIKQKLEFVPTEAIDIARFKAFQELGFEIPETTINYQKIVESLLSNSVSEIWYKLTKEERLGLILSKHPELDEKDARKIARIISYKLHSHRKNGLIQLDELDKQILALRLAGHKQQEIAKTLAIDQSTVSKRLLKIRNKLGFN